MSQQAILGLGSAFGEDQFGWRVIDALQEVSVFSNDNQTTLAKLDHPSQLLSWLADYPRVMLFDAVFDPARPAGSTVVLSAEEVITYAHGVSQFSSHGLGLAEVLAMAKTLGYWPKQFVFCGWVIEG